MTITPTRESNRTPDSDQPEVLIREARRRGRRHLIATALLVVSAVAAVITSTLAFGLHQLHTRPPVHTQATVPPPAVIANAPRCNAASLVVANEGVLAGAGSWNTLFSLRNTSARSCSIAGFPTVRLLTSTGNLSSIPIDYSKGGCTRVRLRGGRLDEECGIGGLKYRGAFPRAILAPHTGVASFFIEGTDVSTWGPHQAHPTVCRNAPRVQLELPPGSAWLTVHGLRPDAIDACGAVAVLPLVPGRSGYFPRFWT